MDVMADISTTSQWIKFFKDAGLPANVAATYAITFYDNRIQLGMLMDLSKEYLYDMGIRVMGDVIAILKYAKEYHTELVKQKMIVDISPSMPAETPATRILERLTKSSPISSVSSKRSLITSRLGIRSSSPAHVAKKPAAHFNSSVISLKRPINNISQISPVKKIRRVLPEEEGGYRIKMPAGNTERSRQILQKRQQVQLSAKKRTVFDRLGDSAVSSSTDIEKNKISSSVFNRLGVNNDAPTSTINLEKPAARITWEASDKGKQSILKRTVYNSSNDLRASNVKQINQILAKNAAVNKRSKIIKLGGNNNRISGKVSILDRLGNKNTKTVKGNARVLSRLGERFGSQKQSTVFDRLGK